MAYKQYFAGTDPIVNRGITERDDVPNISTDLDSVRAYQWEVNFFFDKQGAGDGATLNGSQKPLTLAAKQVNGIGMTVEDIEVNRVNDKVYYPGRASMEEAVVTFDNLSRTKVDRVLYELFGKTYDPRDGQMGDIGRGTASKGKIELVQLQPNGEPRNVIVLMGAYPKALTHGEYNYSTNEFHTLEMTFRYDYFINTNDAEGEIRTTIA